MPAVLAQRDLPRAAARDPLRLAGVLSLISPESIRINPNLSKAITPAAGAVGLSFTSRNFEVEMTVSLESIYNDFHTNLYRFIAGRVSDGDTAEDILQDVYLKIHSHISGLRETDRLESWIYQIARNAIIDTYRRVRPQDELTETLASPLDDESEAVSELASSVRGMLNCLPDAYRQALELTEFQGLSQVELADKLNISVSGAKSRVQRGRCRWEPQRQPHVPVCGSLLAQVRHFWQRHPGRNRDPRTLQRRRREQSVLDPLRR
jgi:RNA polymerase sigma-70 factor, ECF subfamily